MRLNKNQYHNQREKSILKVVREYPAFFVHYSLLLLIFFDFLAYSKLIQGINFVMNPKIIG